MKKTSYKKLFVLLILIGFCFQKSAGKCVLNKVYDNEVIQIIDGLSSITVNLSKQPGGIYFVQLISGDERRTQKIIIE